MTVMIQCDIGVVTFRTMDCLEMVAAVKQIARSIQRSAFVCVLLCGGAAAEEPVLAFQRLLAAQDCNVGSPDGKWGPRTSAAAEALSAASGIEIERPVTEALIGALSASGAKCARPHLLASFVPADILSRLHALDTAARKRLCPLRQMSVADMKLAKTYDRLEGLTSGMSNAQSTPAFVNLDKFAGSLSELAVVAYVADNAAIKGEILTVLANWAANGAYLKTRDCTNGKCPQEWQTERGTDLAPVKDSDSVLERVFPMAFSYYVLLADHERETFAKEHEAIDGWFQEFSKRLRNRSTKPRIYLGFGMGWQWTNLLFDLTTKGPEAFGARLDRVEKGMNPLLLEDGSILDRTTRGSRATWYHYAGINEFVVSLEMLKANGKDAYPEYEERLHRAVEIYLNAVDDPDSIHPWAKEEYRSRGEASVQEYSWGEILYADMGTSWLYIYPIRYPDHPNTVRLNQLLKRIGQVHLRDMMLGAGLACIYRASAPLDE